MVIHITARRSDMYEVQFEDTSKEQQMHTQVYEMARELTGYDDLEFVPVSGQMGRAIGVLVNENGKLFNLPINPAATQICGQLIVGDAVLVALDYNGEYDEFKQNPLRR